MNNPPISAEEIAELNTASTEPIEAEIVPDGEWTPDEAAAHVSEAWQNAVESIVETGRRLIEAKQRIGHGNWLPTVERLPFGKSTAAALMKVAQHPDLSNFQHVGSLPASWGTLEVLAQLPEGEIPKRIDAGEITPELERSTAQQWVSTYAAAKQEALNAWNQFTDAVSNALSYAKTYTPPADTDIYTSVTEIQSRVNELANIVETWEASDAQQ